MVAGIAACNQHSTFFGSEKQLFGVGSAARRDIDRTGGPHAVRDDHQVAKIVQSSYRP
jgi:hypothetical protein